jgi:hypothetical protein
MYRPGAVVEPAAQVRAYATYAAATEEALAWRWPAPMLSARWWIIAGPYLLGLLAVAAAGGHGHLDGLTSKVSVR